MRRNQNDSTVILNDRELPEAIQELQRVVQVYMEKERRELLEIKENYLANR